MNSTVVLLSSHYLPCVEYMQLCAKSNTVIIEQYDNYIKGSYRNRAHIASAAGVQRLSVPLEKGKNQNLPMKDVRISYTENWQRNHWQSLCACYNHSPFFEFYKYDLEEFYKKKPHFLLEWNTRLLQWIFSVSKLKVTIRFTSEYNDKYTGEALDARNYFSPKSVVNSLAKYPQVFEPENGFLSNLSSIDMLFNTGSLKK
jgi:hypothetical protein